MLGEAALIQDAPSSSPSKTPRTSGVEESLPALGRDDSKLGRVGGLVLTRHPGESILIGEEVEVLVVGLKSGTARLKVVAPRTIAVHRREVFDAIRSGPAPTGPSPEPRSKPEPPVPRSGKPAGGLVLARSVRQSIMIGEDVEIAVVEVRPSTVKLRIAAPKSIPVHRREIFEALRAGRG
jgi:carbon storage regulator